MPRARDLIAVASLAAAFLLPAGPAHAQRVDYIDGIGLVDYRTQPKLEIGSWVKYRVTTSNEAGLEDSYFVTVVVAGEERFWGEDCFWVETWTESKGGLKKPIASLLSYDIFEDPEAYAFSKYYARKSITSFDGDTGAEETVNRFPILALQSRKVVRPTWSFDTLGTETIESAKGTFDCTKYASLRHARVVRDEPDSMHTTIVDDRRVDYWSSKIPITHLVRQEIDVTGHRVSVAAGEPDSHGAEAIGRSIGTAELVDWGADAKPMLVPEARQKTIKEQEADRKRKQRRG